MNEYAALLARVTLMTALAGCSPSSNAPPACDDDCEDGGASEDEPDARSVRKDAGAKDAAVAKDARSEELDARAEPASDEKDAASDAGAKDAGAKDAATATGDGGYEALRQLCVDTINMHRATKSLPPMMRAPAANESCSDEGAAYDQSRYPQAVHGSSAAGAVACRKTSVAQNTCPNWPVRGGIDKALVQCLQSMWDEGEPAEGVDACVQAYFDGNTKCFLAHGHYINMISDNKFVSCGFTQNTKGEAYMNQDFSSR